MGEQYYTTYEKLHHKLLTKLTILLTNAMWFSNKPEQKHNKHVEQVTVRG